MGKLKKRSRSSKTRANPLNKAAKQDESLTKTKILPLIQSLQSMVPNEKSMALGTISVMCDDPRFRKLLLKEKLIQIVLERCINASNPEIIVESLGLLRNLVIEEGYDVSIYLWRQNIWITMEKLLSQCSKGFDQLIAGQAFKKSELSQLFDMTENLVSLIVGLSNVADIFDSILTHLAFLKTLVTKILSYSVTDNDLKISLTLFNSLLDLIYDFSTQSEEFIQELPSWEINWDQLSLFVNGKGNELAKIYIQGIKLQSQGQIEGILREVYKTITPINIEQARQVLIRDVDNTKPEEWKQFTKERMLARSQFQSLDISLELIAASLEILGDGGLAPSDDLLRLLLNDIPQVLIALLKEFEFQSRSLIALNNLCWLLVESEDFIQLSGELFASLTAIVIELPLEAKLTAFGSIWALLVVQDFDISEELLNDSLQLYQSKVKDEDLTKLIGFLGQLAKQQGNIARNGVIGDVFIGSLAQNIKGVNLVALLDIFYEIYGDSAFDYDSPVFVERGYLQQLNQLTPKIKNAIKLIDKHVDLELKLKGDEVWNNLGRFIQYKQSERA